MSNARNLANLLGTGTQITTADIADGAFQANKNVIINGSMICSQRGTSFSNIASDTYVVDRFYVNHGSVTPDISQQPVTVGGETGLPIQFTKYARCDFNVSGGANLGIATRLEDTEKYIGTYKLSFYAKGTNPTGGQMAVRFIQRFGSGGSSQVIVDPTSPTFTLTSTWQRFEIDVELPSVSGKTLGSSRYLQLQITQPNGDSGTGAFTLDITGIQLELGDTATPFEHRSYGDELARCQRYYERVSGVSTEQRTFATGKGTSSTNLRTIFYMKTVKRASPTISGTTVRCDVGADATSPSLWLTGLHNVGIDYTTSGLSTNNMYLIYNRGGSADYIDMDAEL